ncbi:hypothetical protein [Sphingomonas phyllosphaerae]|uniref:hypothetical protein n=1 Tax=Sphingomonas phyllosphaerae TaxID=257003 RepID=UPI002FF48C96
MPSLFENAVSSIRKGVGDLRQQDADRDVSAARNLYAGVLLLAKEALIRKAPNAAPALVIGAKLKAVLDGAGGIAMAQIGHTTIDFQQIGQRAADFGVQIDHKALSALNRIRNDMEHDYTSEPATAIRAAIAKGFPVVASLFRQLDEDPLDRLGDAWTTMLETKELYDQEVEAACATYASIDWYSPSLSGATLKCSECGNELVAQVYPENDKQAEAEVRCRSCGAELDLTELVERAIDDLYGAEVYIRAKETGEDGPVHDCPSCDRSTLVEGEERCAACGENVD